MNEASNESRPSLEIEGCSAVAFTENHAATRTRVSLMTPACSDAKVAAQAGGLPIEVMFTGKTKAVLTGIDVLGRVRMSSATTKHCRSHASYIRGFITLKVQHPTQVCDALRQGLVSNGACGRVYTAAV